MESSVPNVTGLLTYTLIMDEIITDYIDDVGSVIYGDQCQFSFFNGCLEHSGSQRSNPLHISAQYGQIDC